MNVCINVPTWQFTDPLSRPFLQALYQYLQMGGEEGKVRYLGI
jgi:hypothetical protein